MAFIFPNAKIKGVAWHAQRQPREGIVLVAAVTTIRPQVIGVAGTTGAGATLAVA